MSIYPNLIISDEHETIYEEVFGKVRGNLEAGLCADIVEVPPVSVGGECHALTYPLTNHIENRKKFLETLAGVEDFLKEGESAGCVSILGSQDFMVYDVGGDWDTVVALMNSDMKIIGIIQREEKFFAEFSSAVSGHSLYMLEDHPVLAAGFLRALTGRRFRTLDLDLVTPFELSALRLAHSAFRREVGLPEVDYDVSSVQLTQSQFNQVLLCAISYKLPPIVRREHLMMLMEGHCANSNYNNVNDEQWLKIRNTICGLAYLSGADVKLWTYKSKRDPYDSGIKSDELILQNAMGAWLCSDLERVQVLQDNGFDYFRSQNPSVEILPVSKKEAMVVTGLEIDQISRDVRRQMNKCMAIINVMSQNQQILWTNNIISQQITHQKIAEAGANMKKTGTPEIWG